MSKVKLVFDFLISTLVVPVAVSNDSLQARPGCNGRALLEPQASSPAFVATEIVRDNVGRRGRLRSQKSAPVTTRAPLKGNCTRLLLVPMFQVTSRHWFRQYAGNEFGESGV